MGIGHGNPKVYDDQFLSMLSARVKFFFMLTSNKFFHYSEGYIYDTSKADY